MRLNIGVFCPKPWREHIKDIFKVYSVHIFSTKHDDNQSETTTTISSAENGLEQLEVF